MLEVEQGVVQDFVLLVGQGRQGDVEDPEGFPQDGKPFLEQRIFRAAGQLKVQPAGGAVAGSGQFIYQQGK